MSEVAQREMPRYKCHKVVHALKLARVERTGLSAVLYPADESYASITVAGNDSFYARLGPALDGDDPGYLVVYKDGYRSWSPTKAFEDGYTQLYA